jgi:hypothetical protein
MGKIIFCISGNKIAKKLKQRTMPFCFIIVYEYGHHQMYIKQN